MRSVISTLDEVAVAEDEDKDEDEDDEDVGGARRPRADRKFDMRARCRVAPTA